MSCDLEEDREVLADARLTHMLTLIEKQLGKYAEFTIFPSIIPQTSYWKRYPLDDYHRTILMFGSDYHEEKKNLIMMKNRTL